MPTLTQGNSNKVLATPKVNTISGATCLASAVFDGKIEIVKLLLRHGADRNASIMRSQQATAKELCKQLKAGNPDIAAIENLL